MPLSLQVDRHIFILSMALSMCIVLILILVVILAHRNAKRIGRKTEIRKHYVARRAEAPTVNHQTENRDFDIACVEATLEPDIVKNIESAKQKSGSMESVNHTTAIKIIAELTYKASNETL